jgi:pilus assembly protein CpaB
MATVAATGPRTLGGRKILILALILGAIAAGLSVAFLASQESTKSPEAALATSREVVVATREIPVGTKLDDSNVKLKSIPGNAVISDPFTNLNDVYGKVTRFPLQANEQLAVGRLVDTAKGTSISFQIPAGLRGFTVKIDDTASPAGLIAPGDFVDVIVADSVKNIVPASGVAIPSTAQVDYKAAVTLLKNVQVISVGRDYINNGVVYDSTSRGTAVDSDKSVSNVTLALTPEQVQLLWLASQDGKVTLSLRGFGDTSTSDLAPVAQPVKVN